MITSTSHDHLNVCLQSCTVVVGIFSDLRKRRSEWWRPRTRKLERGGILTLKRSNRRLGQEFSGIMMTRKKKEAIATTRLNAYVSEELNRPEIYNEKEVCNKLDTIMKRGKFCVWPIHCVFYHNRCRGFRRSVTGALQSPELHSLMLSAADPMYKLCIGRFCYEEVWLFLLAHFLCLKHFNVYLNASI